MSIYIGLYAMFFVLFFFYTVIYGNTEKKDRVMSWSVFFLVTALLALRHQSMGVDLGYGGEYGYLGSFSKLAGYPWSDILQMDSYLNYEKGYVILNKLISSIWNERQFLLAVCALISIYPIARMITRSKDRDGLLSWIIYLGLPCFLMNYSGLRQAIAIGWVFYSYRYIEERKPWKFILLISAAGSMHSSAMVCLIAYPLYHLKVQREIRLLSFIVFPVIYVFRYQIFTLLLRIMQMDAAIDNNGALTLLLLFVFIYIVCSVLWSKDERYNGYLNLFFVAVACQCMGGLHSTVIRVGYYFMMALTILLPIAAKNFGNRRDELIFKCGVGIGFILFAFFSISGSSWAMANPYYFFWR